MPAKAKEGIIHSVKDLLVSIKLTIPLLIILSIVCLIGTLIPQNESPEHYLKLYRESTYNILATTGCLDLFHSWWFLLVMGIFTVNLIACSLNRLPGVWRLIFHGKTILDEHFLQGLSCVKKFTLKKFSPDQETRFAHIISDYLKKPTVIRQPGEWNFFSESGHYTRLGFYLTHLGLVIIIAGAVCGILGFQGYLQITEGQTSDSFILKNSNAMRHLDFSIRCDRFEVTYYGDSQMPKDYKSDLTVIENGKEVLKKTIEVNDPLIYRGIYFYQSSYGAVPDESGNVLIRVTHKNSGKQEELNLKAGSSTRIAGTAYEIRLDQFLSDFSMDSQGKPFNRSSKLNNPAAHLTVLNQGKEEYSTWVFAKFPDFHKKEVQQFDFSFVNFSPKMYTGLQVTRDPGVWVVWAGCLFLILGTYVAFFTSHRRIWLRIEEKGGEFKAVLAGSTNKNHAQFNRDFETLFKNIK
ncbi:MAG: cytochrome c biogenesis protein ResB [Proteobacteria bacterium]|nr:cytochrome c biogenesis protein ResB [Pseudomonadota bacterium]